MNIEEKANSSREIREAVLNKGLDWEGGEGSKTRAALSNKGLCSLLCQLCGTEHLHCIPQVPDYLGVMSVHIIEASYSLFTQIREN